MCSDRVRQPALVHANVSMGSLSGEDGASEYNRSREETKTVWVETKNSDHDPETRAHLTRLPQVDGERDDRHRRGLTAN